MYSEEDTRLHGDDALAMLAPKINSNTAKIGSLPELTTDDGDNLVEAINEVDAHADTAQADATSALNKIGNLANLPTADKSALVNAIIEIASDIATKQNALTFDTTPTEGSTNPVTSGGVKAANAALKADLSAVMIKNTATGNPAELVGIANVSEPFESLTVAINAVQSGSGDPSPDNVRPISGWTGVTVSAGAVNGTADATVAVDWTDEAGTVYGCNINLVSGLMTVTQAMRTFVGVEPWNAYVSQNGFSLVISDMKSGRALSGIANWLKTLPNITEFGIMFGADNTSLYCTHITDSIDSVTDKDTWRSYLAEHPLTVVYPLAEPLTYQLTAPDISALAKRFIWADTGDVTVQYYADTKTYIDNAIAAAVAALS